MGRQGLAGGGDGQACTCASFSQEAPPTPHPPAPAALRPAVHRGVPQGGHVQQRQRHLPHQVCRRRVHGGGAALRAECLPLARGLLRWDVCRWGGRCISRTARSATSLLLWSCAHAWSCVAAAHPLQPGIRPTHMTPECSNCGALLVPSRTAGHPHRQQRSRGRRQRPGSRRRRQQGSRARPCSAAGECAQLKTLRCCFLCWTVC